MLWRYPQRTPSWMIGYSDYSWMPRCSDDWMTGQIGWSVGLWMNGWMTARRRTCHHPHPWTHSRPIQPHVSS